ncbi:hypothetical protein CVS40_7359 [Lucilia cuprina]|nr:hypothetical protein CVS40_7359 [Lucilia cuprina]
MERLPFYALALMASYAAYNMPPETNPYAFAACAVGIIYGVFGLVGGQEVADGIVKGVVDDLLDFVPLALVNIEIFKMMGKPYAFVHALFIIPLILDLIAKLFGEESDDAATQTLKHVSNLANVVSLLYLSYMEDNYMFGYVALSYLAAHTGMVIGGRCHGYLVDLNYIMNTILDTVFNGLLIGTTGYSMFAVNPAEHPFAFTASFVGFCHGCTGIYTRFFDSSCGAEGSEGKCTNRVKKLTSSCMEIITVPLANMDLYRSSKQSSALALGHGLFIIPLAFDLTFKFFATEGDEGESTAILKDLTVLGNIVSLLFFAVNENNLPAGIMSLSAFFSYSGSMVMEYMLNGTEEKSTLAGYALFFACMSSALSAGGEVAT